MQREDDAVKRILFGAFEVDLRAGEIRKHGIRVRLQAQPFRVLEMLLENPGQLVTREELKAKLWPSDSFGDFDHGINKTINKVREALGDSAVNARYVETVARRGYRFIAEVTATDKPTSAVEGRGEDTSASYRNKPRPWLKRHSWWIVASPAVLTLSVLMVWQWMIAARRSINVRSLAVLPLENLSTDVSQEYFADGMTDELITALGSISGLRVISRSSVMLYKHVRKPLPQIARELKVDALVEGTVLRSGQRVRITAQLIRAATDQHLWSHSYEGDLRDTLQLQDDVARAVADQIRVKVTANEKAFLSSAKVVNPGAHDAYLRGRYFWNKRTGQGLTRAIDYFNQAIAMDPNYAQAYSGLADSYALLGDWEYGVLRPEDAFPKAKAAATKALQLEEGLGEAHASLALCLKSFDWNWKTAEAELLQAIHLNPSYASAHQWYGWLLIVLGRNDDGVREMKYAGTLDPLSLIISADIADALLIAHRYDESIAQSKKTIEMDPTFAMAHYQFGQALAQIHHHNEAILELQQAIQFSGGNPIFLSQLGYVYALSGRRSDAMKIIADLKHGPFQHFANPAAIALVYAGLNDKDQAFGWLEKAYQDRFNPSVLTRPCFDGLRSDARFHDLWRRVGLSP